jgi:hypothetical protein
LAAFVVLGCAGALVLVGREAGRLSEWDRTHQEITIHLRARAQEMVNSGFASAPWPDESPDEFRTRIQCFENLCRNLNVPKLAAAR